MALEKIREVSWMPPLLFPWPLQLIILRLLNSSLSAGTLIVSIDFSQIDRQRVIHAHLNATNRNMAG